MWYFCKYKDSLGKPGEGLHSYRVFNLSVLDILFTFLLVKICSILHNGGDRIYNSINLLFDSRNNNS